MGKTRTMYKLGCRDMGVDCDFVATGQTKDEVIQKGVEHAKRDHGMTEMSEEQKRMAMAAIKEE